MQPDDDHAAHVWALPFAERMSILVCSVIENNGGNPPVASLALLHVVEELSTTLGPAARLDVANAMRAASHHLLHDDAHEELEAERDPAGLLH